MVAYGRLKTRENFKLLVLKVLAVAYERRSLSRGSKCSDLTWKLEVFWKTGRWEVVATGGSTVDEIIKRPFPLFDCLSNLIFQLPWRNNYSWFIMRKFNNFWKFYYCFYRLRQHCSSDGKRSPLLHILRIGWYTADLSDFKNYRRKASWRHHFFNSKY